MTMNEMEDSDEWQDLPAEITALIHDQPGLKFNTRPLDSREDLERAYDLLHNFVPAWDDAPKTLGIANLAMTVLFAYGRMISRDRRRQVDEILIFREAPYDVLPRICSGCGQQVLDDPFPYWAKHKPTLYVSWQSLDGCGNLGCGFKYASLKPFHNKVPWSAPVVGRVSKEALDEADTCRAQKPITWLLRTKAELGTLPDEIEVQCPSCPQRKMMKRSGRSRSNQHFSFHIFFAGARRMALRMGAVTVGFGHLWNQPRSLDNLIFPDYGHNLQKEVVFSAITQGMGV